MITRLARIQIFTSCITPISTRLWNRKSVIVRVKYLVVVEGNESEFVLEMEKSYERELKKEAFTCPLCGGRLEKRSGSYGEFYGCTNYGKTGCTFKRKSYSSKR